MTSDPYTLSFRYKIVVFFNIYNVLHPNTDINIIQIIFNYKN